MFLFWLQRPNSPIPHEMYTDISYDKNHIHIKHIIDIIDIDIRSTCSHFHHLKVGLISTGELSGVIPSPNAVLRTSKVRWWPDDKTVINSKHILMMWIHVENIWYLPCIYHLPYTELFKTLCYLFTRGYIPQWFSPSDTCAGAMLPRPGARCHGLRQLVLHGVLQAPRQHVVADVALPLAWGQQTRHLFGGKRAGNHRYHWDIGTLGWQRDGSSIRLVSMAMGLPRLWMEL